MPRVSAEHKEAVRRRLLDAALTCLERNGYRDVTTRAVVAEAHLSTGTFYNYFPAKEDLYAALAEEALAGRPEDASPGNALLVLLRGSWLADPTWSMAVASFRARSGSGPEAGSRLDEVVISTLSPLVVEAIEDGVLRADLDAEALVELLDIVWDGMGRRAATDALWSSYGRVARVLVQVLLDGAVSPARRSEVPNA